MKHLKMLAAAAAGCVTVMSCNETAQGPAYIGPAEIEVNDGKMTTEIMLSMGRVSDPQLSPDGSLILYRVGYTSVAENRTCGNIFVCAPDGSGKTQLTKEGSGVSNARWIEGGKKIAFLKEGQIYVAPFSGNSLGKAVKMSSVPRGISEFSVSPDGSHVLYVSTVPSDVKTATDVDPKLDKASAYITEDLDYRHWDHWVTELNHSYVAPWGSEVNEANSVDILGGADVKFELPLAPHSGIEQLCWSPDGKMVAYSCKKLTGREYAFSTDTEIYVYDLASGKTSVIPMGGGYDTDPVWSPDGSMIAWLSMARNGYEADKARLMCANVAVSEDGSAAFSGITDLTADFKYNAAGPMWAPDGSCVYFNALAEGVQGIFSASAEGVKRHTPEDDWFDYNSPFAVLADGTLLASYCSMDFPTELVSVRDGAHSQITKENESLLGQLAEHKTEKRYVKTVDGKDMLTWVLFPPQFDESKKYPVIEIFLGGPQGTLSQSWSTRWNYRLMAAQGYIVVLPNRRGTTAFGQEWTEQISGDYIGMNMQDYLAAARMIKAEPYAGKIAGVGASYGGYSVYYMAGIHDGTFDCFVAHAGIFDEQYMYYTTEEMWFPNWDNGGLTEYAYAEGQTGPAGDGVTFGGIQQAGSPWSDMPKARRHYSNSPAANVTKWDTPILCIHGMNDYRIPYDQGMAAFNSARMMGVPAKLVVFPEENHWILQPQNSVLWHEELFGWVDRWCR